MARFAMIESAVLVTRTATGTTNGGSYSFGTASGDRIMVAALSAADAVGGGTTVSSVLVASVTATHIKSTTLTSASIWAAPVPTGTSGAITVSGPSLASIGLTIYAMTGANPLTAYATTAASGSSIAKLDVPTGGAMIAIVIDLAGATYTWTGLVEDSDFAQTGVVRTSSASNTAGTIQSMTGTGTPSVAGGRAIAAASWSP